MSDDAVAAPVAAEIPHFETFLEGIDTFRAAGPFRSGAKAYRAIEPRDGGPRLKLLFDQWLDDPTYWNGTTAPAIGSDQYRMVRGVLDFTSNIFADAFRIPVGNAFHAWLRDEPEAFAKLVHPAALAANPAMDADLFRAELYQVFGHRITLDAEGKPTRVSGMFNDPRNQTYMTKVRGEDGSDAWVILSEDKIARMVADPRGPNVIVTGTHAFYEHMDDLYPLPDMYEKIAEHAAGVKIKGIDEKPGKGDTVMVCATFTRENNVLNLEGLFRRLHHIHQHHDTPQDDCFTHSSPMAVSMVALILKSIVTNPERITFPTNTAGVLDLAPGEKPNFFLGDGPIHLKPDAAQIVKKLLFNGFSMCGNAQRDGMRMLTHQLDAKGPDGQPRVVAPTGSISDVLANLSVTVSALNEVHMADYYREHGVRVPLLSNNNDSIAPARHNDGTIDPAFHYRGDGDYFGHAPAVKLTGIYGNPKKPSWTDADIIDHYRCTHLPLVGGAAITALELCHDTATDQHHLVLRLGANSRRLSAQQQQRLQGMLDTLDMVDISANGHPLYMLRPKEGFGERLTPSMVQEVRRAFDRLQKPGDDLYVSRAITEYQIPELNKQAVRMRTHGEQGKLDPVALVEAASNMRNIAGAPHLREPRLHSRINCAPATHQVGG